MGRRRFVDMRVIHRRMNQTDARFERAQRRKHPELFAPALVPVVEVKIVPAGTNCPGPVVDVALEPTPRARAERQCLDAGQAEDVRRQLAVRPHVAHRREDFDRCAVSKYGTHRFVANVFTCCEFCGRNYKDCLVTK